MLHIHKSNLILLAFEKDITKSLHNGKFVGVVVRKPRRIRL